jgi:hypothetical protein
MMGQLVQEDPAVVLELMFDEQLNERARRYAVRAGEAFVEEIRVVLELVSKSRIAR